jgi:hypothetical protein
MANSPKSTGTPTGAGTAGLKAHQRPIVPLAGKSPRQGGATLADRIQRGVEKIGSNAVHGRMATDNDDGTETIRHYIEIPNGGDRVSGVGATDEEAVADLESKLFTAEKK